MEGKKRRRALTDADRSMIRKRNQTHPLAQQKDLILREYNANKNP